MRGAKNVYQIASDNLTFYTCIVLKLPSCNVMVLRMNKLREPSGIHLTFLWRDFVHHFILRQVQLIVHAQATFFPLYVFNLKLFAPLPPINPSYHEWMNAYMYTHIHTYIHRHPQVYMFISLVTLTEKIAIVWSEHTHSLAIRRGETNYFVIVSIKEPLYQSFTIFMIYTQWNLNFTSINSAWFSIFLGN